MSILSAHCLRFPATTDIGLLNSRGIGTLCDLMPMPQEKTKIFKSRFHYFYVEQSLQEYHHKAVMKKRMNKRHEVVRMHSSRDGDTGVVRISKLDEYKNLLHAIYKFSRPYAIFGTIMNIASVSFLPINSWAQLTPYFFIELLKAIVPFVLLHFYCNGLNQICDLEIDKVNKPFLPLVSGRISVNFAIGMVVTSLIMGLGMGIRFGSPASSIALVLMALLGSFYSIELPYMRWKRNPLLAGFCIVFLRSVLVPLPHYIHMQKYVLGEPIVLCGGIIFAASFMFIFAIVVSFFKDIPDIDGDKLFDITTFSVKFGKKRMFWLCIGILMADYGGAMAIGMCSSSLFNKIVTVVGHFSLAFFVMNKALRIDEINKESTQAFYMFIWKLFYAEYLLIPFMR